MSKTIAVSGKGGTGKTTLAAMIIRSLLEQTHKAVLAVDADPNSCLGLMMGVAPAETIAEIREQSRQKKPTRGGMDRVSSFEYGIQQAITEAEGFDLVTMGRPEGPQCYCAANNLLRRFLDQLSSSYEFVVIDNEAGMEHLSRRTTNDVDLLLIAAERTPLGVITTQRIFELTRQLPIVIRKVGVVWNKITDSSSVERIGADALNSTETFGCVPYDEAVADASMEGKTIFDVNSSSPAFSAVQKILEQRLM